MEFSPQEALHFLLFGLAAFFAVGWWAQRPAWSIVAVLGLLALLEEVSQALLPGRSADLLDLVVALAGMAAFAWLSRRLTRRAAVRNRAQFPLVPPPAAPPVGGTDEKDFS